MKYPRRTRQPWYRIMFGCGFWDSDCSISASANKGDESWGSALWSFKISYICGFGRLMKVSSINVVGACISVVSELSHSVYTSWSGTLFRLLTACSKVISACELRVCRNVNFRCCRTPRTTCDGTAQCRSRSAPILQRDHPSSIFAGPYWWWLNFRKWVVSGRTNRIEKHQGICIWWETVLSQFLTLAEKHKTNDCEERRAGDLLASRYALRPETINK